MTTMSSDLAQFKPARSTRRRRARIRRCFTTAIRYLIIILSLVVILFPIYWMVLTTVQPEQYALTYPPYLFPKGLSLAAVVTSFQRNPILTWVWHSTLVSAIAVAITLVLAVPGAFLLAKLHWRGSSLFGFVLLFMQMMPGAIIIVPLITIYRDLNFENNLFTLAFIYGAFTTPIGCWILKVSFDGIPHEIYDAALVDGCGPMRALFYILVPLSRPGLVAVAIIAYFGAWNDYLFASAFVTDRSLYTAGEGLASFISAGNYALFELMGAGVIFAAIPIALYLLVQRNVIRGLTAGSVKG